MNSPSVRAVVLVAFTTFLVGCGASGGGGSGGTGGGAGGGGGAAGRGGDGGPGGTTGSAGRGGTTGSAGTTGGSGGATAGTGGAAGGGAGRGGAAGGSAGTGGGAGAGGRGGTGGGAGGATGAGGAGGGITHTGCIAIGGAGDRVTITQRDFTQGICHQFSFDNITATQSAGLTLPQGWGNGRGQAFANANCTGTAISPSAVTGTVAWMWPDGGSAYIADVDLTFMWVASIPGSNLPARRRPGDELPLTRTWPNGSTAPATSRVTRAPGRETRRTEERSVSRFVSAAVTLLLLGGCGDDDPIEPVGPGTCASGAPAHELLGAPLLFSPTTRGFGLSAVLGAGDPATLHLRVRAAGASAWTEPGPPTIRAPDSRGVDARGPGVRRAVRIPARRRLLADRRERASRRQRGHAAPTRNIVHVRARLGHAHRRRSRVPEPGG